MHEARYYNTSTGGGVECCLCPHGCRIEDGGRGLCLTREVRGGKLYAKAYAGVCSAGFDPVEKKPLYHFYPGTDIYSIGSWGCNFKCTFCQNWEISQREVSTSQVFPKELPAMASGSIGVAYTYNEPYINFEYVLESCREMRECGLKNVMVSNGYYNLEPLRELLDYVDAFNIDIKAFSEDFYRTMCGGKLAPVLAAAAEIARSGKAHLELTTLLIPGANDDPGQLRSLAAWIADNCGELTPLHLSAYFPRYKCSTPATGAQDLLAAAEIFKERLRFVYLGNINMRGAQDTYCYECGDLLVQRDGYQTRIGGMDASGGCISCGADNNFVMN